MTSEAHTIGYNLHTITSPYIYIVSWQIYYCMCGTFGTSFNPLSGIYCNLQRMDITCFDCLNTQDHTITNHALNPFKINTNTENISWCLILI